MNHRYYPYVLFVVVLQFITAELPAQTRQLTSFDTLVAALTRGEQVRAVIRYADCRHIVNGKVQERSPGAIAGMELTTWEYFEAGFIPNSPAFLVFSEAKLIRQPSGKGFVYNYGKVKVYTDNSVRIAAQFLEPRRLRIRMDEQYEGRIDDSSNKGGISFFVNQ